MVAIFTTQDGKLPAVRRTDGQLGGGYRHSKAAFVEQRYCFCGVLLADAINLSLAIRVKNSLTAFL